MATHSSVLAWRIPGTGEPGGLPSTRTHRVAPDWSDLAAAYGSFYALASGVDATYIVPFRPRNSRWGHIIYPRSPTSWWRLVTERCFVTWQLQTSVSTFQSKGGPWTLGQPQKPRCVLPGSHSPAAPCSQRRTGCDSSRSGTCHGSARNTAGHRWFWLLKGSKGHRELQAQEGGRTTSQGPCRTFANGDERLITRMNLVILHQNSQTFMFC